MSEVLPTQSAAREIEGEGTSEEAWQAWGKLATLAPLDLHPAARLLVVAPHPDDEILALGGLLQRHPRARIVAVTDGEASHPDSSVLDPTRLAALRRDETSAALRALGAPDVRVTRLALPDGGVTATAVANALDGLLDEGDVCLATWRRDGHPDHEAVGEGAALACAGRGARLLEYPVWTWHWARPGDERVPWHRARRIPLDAAAREHKRLAIGEFRTQILPLGPALGDRVVLPPRVLARFHRDLEIVFE